MNSDDAAYLNWLTDGGLFSKWPTEDGWDYALQVHQTHNQKAVAEAQPEAQAAHVEEEVEHLHVEGIGRELEFRLIITPNTQQQIVEAAASWMDHGCADAVQTMADLTMLIADEILGAWGQEAGL